ncbi:hypothetical protein I5M32_01795 [Pedobacter sp. SD-b]|uniref:WD40-like Beta Propeller Repeat n=1 Tax=Pedobacter segetis TaxID=2793069 RepID=A0ABS1BFW1_9SPHI|nr:hypothetical protein [Pedobacter segetis]MBK0381681.1 hypothetical protein [Pedobacter segetis]
MGKRLKYFKVLISSILCLFISIITSQKGFAQIFDASQNPPSVKFKQINTPQFQIIYPTLFESEAQRMANVLNAIIPDVAKSLGRLPKPISVILQTQGVSSNGFVQMAPRRSEFYTIPGQEFDAQDWLNSLAVHELRHVVQFDKIAPNFNAPLFEELKLALFGINLPPWYFEGDAVGIETALTHAGRGRQPNFELVLRANELSKKRYSYSKNYFGSFKDYTPGYYPLGYFMTTKIRRDFGPQILDKILERIKNLPIRPYNFSSSLKKFGGIGTHQLYFNTMDEMDSLWGQQTQKVKPQKYALLNREIGKIPTSYLLPYQAKNGDIICIKSSKAETTKIISISKEKQEKDIIKIGYQTEPNLSYADHKITWDEYRSDVRFDQRSFNVICTYDLATNQFKQLTHKTRLFSPSLSSDGKKIVAVQVSTENIFNLIELNAETGEVIKTYPNPKNFTLQTPSYDPSGNEIIVTAVNEAGKTLILYKSGLQEILIPQATEIISRPIFYQNKIVYKAHYNGIDNIYALDLKTKEIEELTNVAFGAYNPSINENSGLLLFNNYQSKGYNINSVDLKAPDAFKAFKQQNTFVKYFEPLLAQEIKSNVFDSIPNITFKSKPYKEIGHLFYFHSAKLINETNGFTNDNNYGIDLVSNNKLNTMASSFGYRYNNALNKSEFRASITYQKFYPQITVNYENRARLSYYKQFFGPIVTILPFDFRENYTALNVNLPVSANWLNKNFYSALAIETYYANRYNLSFSPPGFLKSINFPLKYSLSLGLNTRTSERDLAPKWGQNFSLTFEHLPFEKALNGDNLFFKSVFYFPGIATNHSLSASFNWQENSCAYQFNIDIPRASGYANLNGIENLSNTLLIDYRFPIAYPDWEIGPLAYVKRIKGGFFTDFENIGNGNGLRTYGAELRADMNLLRFYLPNFDIGGKVIIPNQQNIKNPIFELILNFNL